MTEGAFESSSPAIATYDREGRFGRIYEEHFSGVYAYFLRRAAPGDVGDLVSEVFLVVWRRMDDLPPASEERLWIYGVARRIAGQHQRSIRRRARLSLRAEQDVALRSSEGHGGIESNVAEVLDRLRPRDRELVKLLVWDGLTREEAASVLGCSVNAVGIRWHRSLKQIRRKLGLTDDSDGPEGETRSGGT